MLCLQKLNYAYKKFCKVCWLFLKASGFVNFFEKKVVRLANTVLWNLANRKPEEWKGVLLYYT